MIVTIKSGEEEKRIQLLLNQLSNNLSKKKENILKNTFGKVKIHPTKSPIEIQKELRDEWN